MLAYKNTSFATKTFYGVTFKPGEIHEVPGYINNPKFIKVDASLAKPSKLSKAKTVDDAVESKPSTMTKSNKQNKEESSNGTDSDK